MGEEFYNNYELVKKIFKLADERLGFSISKIILEGPEDKLQLTKNTQPGSPYYTNSEVNSMLADIDDFWTVTPATLESMASSIESRFGF